MNNPASVVSKAFARAGLLGNPSDGYHGKTISMAIADYHATVKLEHSSELKIQPSPADRLSFESIHAFHDSIQRQGYYGGVRLIKAAMKRFVDYCDTLHELDAPNFTISFSSTIPRQVGLAGSSAIVTATLRALCSWYDIQIPPHLLASLTLSAETELGIPAGLQDRVIQAYQGVVYMDFSRENMKQDHGLEYGDYHPLPIFNTDRFYIAFASDAGEPTEVLHNNLRSRFNAGDEEVVQAMSQFAELAKDGVQALKSMNLSELSNLIDRNFDLRRSICQLHPHHVMMVETARQLGASAKYCGSGGAIIGILPEQVSIEAMQTAMSDIDCTVFQPMLANHE